MNAVKAPSELEWFPNQSHQKEILLRSFSTNPQNASILCFPIRVKQNKLESESGSENCLLNSKTTQDTELRKLLFLSPKFVSVVALHESLITLESAWGGARW